jgi:hypothetical protein
LNEVKNEAELGVVPFLRNEAGADQRSKLRRSNTRKCFIMYIYWKVSVNQNIITLAAPQILNEGWKDIIMAALCTLPNTNLGN